MGTVAVFWGLLPVGGKDVFPGEDPRHHMRKTRVQRPKVSCGTCRQFDTHAWCNRWNFATSAESPPCDQYRAAGSIKPST